MGLEKPPTDPLHPVKPGNARNLRITATAGTQLVVAYSKCPEDKIKVVYNPKAFIPHAVSLRQTFVHCARFLTAATRRCMGRIAVPLLAVMLSHRLPVIALVSHYLTNKLIGRRLLLKRNHRSDTLPLRDYLVLVRLSTDYSRLQGRFLRVTNPFAAPYPKAERSTCMPYPRRQRSS